MGGSSPYQKILIGFGFGEFAFFFAAVVKAVRAESCVVVRGSISSSPTSVTLRLHDRSWGSGGDLEVGGRPIFRCLGLAKCLSCISRRSPDLLSVVVWLVRGWISVVSFRKKCPSA